MELVEKFYTKDAYKKLEELYQQEKPTAKPMSKQLIRRLKKAKSKVIGALRQGLKDAKEGKIIRVVDQDKFFKSL